MSTYKIKNKLNSHYFKRYEQRRETTWTKHNQTNSMSNIWDSFKFAGLLEKNDFSFTYLPAAAHTVALLGPSWSTPCFCSSWWSSHGTSLSKLMEFSASGLWFHQNFSLAYFMVLSLIHGPIMLGLQLLLRLHLHQWPCLVSPSANLQMFSVTPHSFIHQCNLDYFYPT